MLASETRNKGVVSALLSSWLLFEALVRAVLLSAVMLSAVALAYNRSPRPFTAHAYRLQCRAPSACLLHSLRGDRSSLVFGVAAAAELYVTVRARAR